MPRSKQIYKKKKVPTKSPPAPVNYILIDLQEICNGLKIVVQCIKCKRSTVKIELVSHVGLWCKLKIYCTSCTDVAFNFNNSAKVGTVDDINLRFIYGLRATGKGKTAAQTFCELMGLPNPPKDFSKYQSILLDAVKSVASESIDHWLAKAIESEGHENNLEANDCPAAFDGTWRKRGHNSSVVLNKVIDVQVHISSLVLY